MSGICAIVDLSGRPVDPEPLRAMAAASPHRGPDGTTYWHEGSVALAHQALHATEEDLRDRQPLVTERGVLRLVADARIYDQNRLFGELKAQGRRENGAPTDAELILAAYRQWGTDCPSHLVGDFAFVLWDGRVRRLLCARDAPGVRPLHYARRGRLLVLASEAQQVLAHPGVPCRLDDVSVADYLALNAADEERTFFRDVRRLPPGHFLVADDRGIRRVRYWDPRVRPTIRYRRSADYAAHYLDLFHRAVRDRLRTNGKAVGIYMSGGLDSCSVAAVAARELRRNGKGTRLVAQSYAFDRLKECDERHYSRPVARRLGIEIEYLPVERYPLLANEEVYRPPLESPFVAWEEVHRRMRRRLVGHGARVALTGHAGEYGSIGHDRILFLSRLLRSPSRTLAELARHARASGTPLSRVLSNYLLKPLLPGVVVRRLQRARGHEVPPVVPDWISPALVDRTRLRERLAEPSRIWRLRHPDSPRARDRFRRLGSVARAVYWQDRREAADGMELRHPFLDRRLMEYVARIPPEQVYRAGWTRVVLRRAMAGLLPDVVRLRPGKTKFGAYFDLSLDDRAVQHVEELFRDSWLERLGFIDGEKLRRTFRHYVAEPKRTFALWFPITMERWLRENHGRFHDLGL